VSKGRGGKKIRAQTLPGMGNLMAKRKIETGKRKNQDVPVGEKVGEFLSTNNRLWGGRRERFWGRRKYLRGGTYTEPEEEKTTARICHAKVGNGGGKKWQWSGDTVTRIRRGGKEGKKNCFSFGVRAGRG